jgi:hypothetical protein
MSSIAGYSSIADSELFRIWAHEQIEYIISTKIKE